MWNIIWLFLWFLQSRTQSTELKVEDTELAILSERNYTENVEGANVTITCEARNLENNPVSWFYNDEQIAVVLTEGGEESIVYLNPGQHSSKYSLTSGPGDGGNFTFTIHNLSLDDVGVVSCRVSNAESADHRIDVLRYPNDVKIDVETRQSIIETNSDLFTVETGFNDWLNLSCFVLNSRPSAEIVWYWNGTNPISDLNLTEVKVTEKMNLLYNTSNILYISPDFLQTLFGLNRMNMTNETFQSGNSTANSSSLHEQLTDEEKKISSLINVQESSINLTCRATVVQWNDAKSVLVEVGTYQSNPSYTEEPGNVGGVGAAAENLSQSLQIISLAVLFSVKIIMLICY